MTLVKVIDTHTNSTWEKVFKYRILNVIKYQNASKSKSRTQSDVRAVYNVY